MTADIRADLNPLESDDTEHLLPVQLDPLGGDVKRAMGMLRMGRATSAADEELAVKKAMGMWRMGRSSVGYSSLSNATITCYTGPIVF